MLPFVSELKTEAREWLEPFPVRLLYNHENKKKKLVKNNSNNFSKNVSTW